MPLPEVQCHHGFAVDDQIGEPIFRHGKPFKVFIHAHDGKDSSVGYGSWMIPSRLVVYDPLKHSPDSVEPTDKPENFH